MPRLSLETNPKYRKHRASGKAIVTLSGKDHYLGAHGSKASHEMYNRLVGEWRAAGQAPLRAKGSNDFTVTELCNCYRKFAESYYVKNGKLTDTVYMVKGMIAAIRLNYGRIPATEFGPLALQALQQSMTEQSFSRDYINRVTSYIKAMYRWASNQELIAPSVFHALKPVPGLKKGRTKARETEAVGPVADEIVAATLPKLPRVVADMVRLQILCGCRPGEICQIRPVDVDRSRDVWSYTPASHKTEHHGRSRRIFIGPQAQDVLRPYLLRAENDFCFKPSESEAQRNSIRREQRQSPMTPSQTGRKPKRNPVRSAGDCYTNASYRRAISRASDIIDREAKESANDAASAAGIAPKYEMTKDEERLFPNWHPNQLRHNAATRLREKFGIEAAQVVLGHSELKVTQVYAERDFAAASRIMAEVG